MHSMGTITQAPGNATDTILFQNKIIKQWCILYLIVIEWWDLAHFSVRLVLLQFCLWPSLYRNRNLKKSPTLTTQSNFEREPHVQLWKSRYGLLSILILHAKWKAII